MENINEQFNNGVENDLEILRGEVGVIKEKAEESREKDDFEGETEDEGGILDVELEKLTDRDLRLFQTLKKVQSGEMNFQAAWKYFEVHKLAMSKYISSMSEDDPTFDFSKNSRVAFFDWLSEKLLDNYKG